MARKSRLLTALESHKGRDYKLEKQKKLQKQAQKRKRETSGNDAVEDEGKQESVQAAGVGEAMDIESDGWESDESSAALGDNPPILMDDESDSDSSLEDKTQDAALSQLQDEHKSVDSDQESQEEDQGEDIALSDIESLASDEKADIIPHQRLTINNTAALRSALKTIAISTSLPFSSHQSVTSFGPTDIPDVNDDLNRELAFYKQCIDAANTGRELLKKEGIPFSRPSDFFAEMVKSDEHMGKIKQKLVDDAASKKAANEARKQRDLKKFGKQVQVAKEQERARERRATLDKIGLLKRKRKNTDTGTTNEEDLFDVALEDAATEDKQSRSARRDAKGPNKKRQKDEKFGFGGRKRFSKSGDALSTGDLSSFSAKNMKGKKGGTKRLGKSRRAKPS